MEKGREAYNDLIIRPWWTPRGTVRQLPDTVKVVPACVADQGGVHPFYRALDSSSLTHVAAMFEGMNGSLPFWKARRDYAPGQSKPRVDVVPIVTLDAALSAASVHSLFSRELPIDFIKSDTNGNDGGVLRGAARLLQVHVSMSTRLCMCRGVLRGAAQPL
mmetsp:Transcript_82912/g.165518  ORF Transcript_82912/g.165518 Transcript_82912/m.165518 type:complete len:161 (-) Transcript_82912:953-1435(-)